MNAQDLIAMSQMNAWGTPALYEGQPQGFAPQQPPPQQPGPMYPGPPQQPQQGGFDLNAFLSSPSYAAALGSINNISRMNRDQPAINVMDQYQQSVRQNAILRMRQEQQRRMEEAHARQMDPLYEFNQFVKQRGLEDAPYEDQLAEFQRFRTSATSGRPVKTWTGENGNMWYLDSGGNPIDTGVKGSPARDEIVDVGGVPYVKVTEPGGGVRTMPLEQYQQGYRTGALASEAEAEEGGKQTAKTAAEQVNLGLESAWQSATAYTDAQEMIDASEQFLAMLKDGTVDTGPITSFLYNTLGIGTEEIGAMNNEAIMQTLRNLGITNLAPVTEREFASVMKLWADIALQEKPNIGSVERTIARTKKLQERMMRDARTQAGRVRTYGGEEAYQNLIRANPFIAEQMGATSSAPAPAAPDEDIPGPDTLPTPDAVWGKDEQGNIVRLK